MTIVARPVMTEILTHDFTGQNKIQIDRLLLVSALPSECGTNLCDKYKSMYEALTNEKKLCNHDCKYLTIFKYTARGQVATKHIPNQPAIYLITYL